MGSQNQLTGIFKRLLSLWVLISFLVTNSFLLPVHTAIAADQIDVKIFPENLSSVLIPEQIGKVQEFYKGKGKGVIVLIQDAHAIPDAQRQIQKLIEYFGKEYGIRLVALEGAASELDPQILRSFPDKEILKKTFEEYFEAGELTGTNAAAIFGETLFAFHGIEDWNLYEEGLNFYLSANEKQEALLRKISSKTQALQKQKASLYSEKLLDLDSILADFYSNRSNLIEVLTKLTAFETPEKGSEVAVLLEQIQKEKDAPQIDQRPHSLRRSRERFKDMEGVKFFSSFEAYARSIKDGLFRSEEERQLDREGRKLFIIERLIRLELTRKEWDELKALLAKTEVLLAGLEAHIDFYHNAEKRDGIFLKNFTELMKKQAVASSILVTGGFHTEGLIQKLKDKGISYVLLMPQINLIPEQSHYQDHMRGEVSWKDYFQIENGKLNLSEAFLRASRDRLLNQSKEDRTQLLKNWRDQIIRDLAQKEKITEVGTPLLQFLTVLGLADFRKPRDFIFSRNILP